MYWRHKRKSNILYCSEPLYLDIETAWNHSEENPISWVVSVQVKFDGVYQLFRSPIELMEYLNLLCDTYELCKTKRIVIYIHNASYDLSYLIQYIQLYLPYKEDRFGIYDGEHKIITYQQGGYEFRCTFMLTQQSLEKWSESMNVEHKKKVGLYDYSKVIYQDTELSDSECMYDEYDILAMEESFAQQLKLHGDNITTVPLTMTGYIRRKLRLSCIYDRYYREKYFYNSRLDAESYEFCKKSYAGGFTHNNRFYRGVLVKALGGHRDFRSHYPSQMTTYPLPFGKPEVYYDITKKYYRETHKKINVQQILDLYPRFSTITKLQIVKMELKSNEITMPFMQVSKMYGITKDDKLIADNGRLLKLIKGKFTTYVDNHTLKILLEQYNIKGTIIKVYRFKNYKLPDCMRTVIDELYKAKTDLKILEKECEEQYGKFSEETINAHMQLMLSKSLLNSIYGCMAMNPIRMKYDMDFEQAEPFIITKAYETQEELQEALDDYYNGFNNFLPYQVGCFITQLAKYELYEYIKCIGYDKVLYCDTDSIFYLKDDETEKRIEALNAEKNKTAPYIIDSKGNRVYYDSFDKEEDWLAFKGLHSKCYGIVTTKEELQITVAGIPARTLIYMQGEKPLYLTREEELSGITEKVKRKNPDIKIKDAYKALERLENGRTFYTNTGTTCKYEFISPQEIEIDGHTVHTAGGAIIQKLQSKMIKDIDCDETIEIEMEETNFD